MDTEEMKTAFLCGELDWSEGDRCIQVHVKKVGAEMVAQRHNTVTVTGLHGATPAGVPIYEVENEFGDKSYTSGEYLTTWDNLMFDERGMMSRYAKSLASKIDREQRRLAAGKRTPIRGTITVLK